MALDKAKSSRQLHERFRDPSGTPGQIFVVAHRGVFLNEDGIELAENSISAIERAKAIGCDMVEVDVRFTVDGTAVVMHDPTIDRTTNQTGEIAHLSYSEISQIDLVHPANKQPFGDKIPSLEQAFQALGDQMMINVELKTGIDFMPEIARIAAKAGVSQQLTVKSNLKEATQLQSLAETLAGITDPIDFIPVVVDSRDGIEELERACELFRPNCVECVVDLPRGKDTGYNLLERRGVTQDGGVLFSQEARRIAARYNARLFINTLYVNAEAPGNHQWNGGRNCEFGRFAPDSIYGFWIAHGATVIQTDNAPFVIDWLRQSGFKQC